MADHLEIECVAQALWEHNWVDTRKPWDDLKPSTRGMYLELAECAIMALDKIRLSRVTP